MKDVTRDKFDHDIVYEFVSMYDGIREDGTLTGYRWSAKNFIDYIEEHRTVDLDEVDWTDIDAFIRWMASDYPDSTVKTRYNHLRTFFAWLTDHKEYYNDNPIDADELEITDYIDRGRTAKKDATHARGGIVFVTPEEYDQLVENAPKPKFRNELIIKMLWHLGLRRMELVDIKLGRHGHINLDEQYIDVPPVKSEDTRRIWFRNELKVPLKRWIRHERDAVFYAEESDYLFPSRGSTQLTPKRVTATVAEAAERAGIQETLYTDAKGDERRRITPHAIRHGFAVHHVRNGTNVKVLKDLMGHEDISTTQIYLQFDDKTQRQAQHRNAPSV